MSRHTGLLLAAVSAIPMDRVDIVPYCYSLCSLPQGGTKGTAAKEAAQFAFNNIIIYSAKTTINTNHSENLVKRRETIRLRRRRLCRV